jgi:Tfp pilus assembly PilM family ATPase
MIRGKGGKSPGPTGASSASPKSAPPAATPSPPASPGAPSLAVLDAPVKANAAAPKHKLSLPKLGGKTPVLSGSGLSSAKGGAKVVLGVDLGPDSLRMAKTTGTGSKRKLLAYERIGYDANLSPNAPEFAGFLRSKLKEFTAGAKVDIWALISSAKAELWHITIPKVPRRQITEAVFWSVKKEKQFDEAEFILDFDVLGEISEKGVPKFAVTVYLAPRKQVEDLTNLFSKAGFKLTGVTIAPIAIQTLFRTKWVQTNAATYANLYVGRNWSRIDIFQKANLVLSRGIKAGTNSMVEALVDSFNLRSNKASQDAQNNTMATMISDEPIISMSLDDDEPSITMGPSGAGTASFSALDFEQAKKVLNSKLLNGGVLEGPGSDLEESEVVEMILPAAERLVRQIERTFEYHSTTMGNEPVEQIFFSGPICTNKLILQYMYGQLGIESLLLDPLNPQSPALGKLATPENMVERMEYNLVVALSLSDNEYTPNLLYTYKSKEKDRHALQIEKIIYAVTLLIVVGLAATWWWQRGAIGAAQRQLAQVKSEIAKYTPPATPELLKSMAEGIVKKNIALKNASLRYESLSSLSEINELAPSYISALNIRMDLGAYTPLTISDPSKQEPKQQAQAKKTPKNLFFDGFIEGKQTEEECKTAFSSFLIRLENSILFDKPTILKETFEEFGNKGKVYHFVIQIPLS